MSVVSLFQTVKEKKISRQSIALSKRALSEADAVDIWIARWLRIRRKDILVRYGCDPRRIYEIWERCQTPSVAIKGAAAVSNRISRPDGPG